jgi:hypothetical protein
MRFLLGLVFGLIIGYAITAYMSTNQAHTHTHEPPVQP